MIAHSVGDLRSHCFVRCSVSVSRRWPLISFTRYRRDAPLLYNYRPCVQLFIHCWLTADRLLLFRLPTPSTSRLPAQSLSADDCSDGRGVHSVQQSVPWRRRQGCMRSGLDFLTLVTECSTAATQAPSQELGWVLGALLGIVLTLVTCKLVKKLYQNTTFNIFLLTFRQRLLPSSEWHKTRRWTEMRGAINFLTSMTGCSTRHLAMNGNYQHHSEEGNSWCQNINRKTLNVVFW